MKKINKGDLKRFSDAGLRGKKSGEALRKMTDMERGLSRFAYLMTKHMSRWLDPIKNIIYHDEFEQLIEYNGFLTEV